MEILISIDTIGVLVTLFTFTLILASTGMRRTVSRAPQRSRGLRQSECRAHALGIETTVSGQAREGCPPAHGKERTPC
jgi:hypothetical protein